MEPPRPPKSSPSTPEGLDEVERALSVLGGRHPDAVRAERESHEASRKRREEVEAQVVQQAGRAKLRNVALGLLGVLALGVVGLVLVWRSKGQKRDAAFAALEKDYTGLGFKEVDGLEGTSLAFDTDDGACYAIVAGPEASGASVTVERGAQKSVAKGASLLCACAVESLAVSAPVGVRVLRASAESVGGLRALAFQLRDVTLVPGTDACDADQLGAWIRAGKPPKGFVRMGLLEAHPLLRDLGFEALSGAASPFPFAVLEPRADRCYLAIAEKEGTTLSLTPMDSAAVVSGKRALGVCDAKGEPWLVRREGEGEIDVVSVEGKRIGGLLGFRETLQSASIDAALWVRDDQHGFFAEETLHASLVPDPKSVPSGALLGSQAPDARVVALSVKGGRMYVADGDADAAFHCEPTMRPEAPETICIQTKAQSWHLPTPDTVGAIAYGPLPFWMSGHGSVKSADVLAPELDLLSLARRLSARGFEPTIIEGITERPNGVEILGRSAEDAVVAVGVWPAPPWVYAYTDGPPWNLEDEPHMVPLRGGNKVLLVAKTLPGVAPAQRRTVVFRHAVK